MVDVERIMCPIRHSNFQISLTKSDLLKIHFHNAFLKLPFKFDNYSPRKARSSKPS